MNAPSGVGGVLVTALRKRLLADHGLAALVDKRIYDEVPSDDRGQPNLAILPWVFFGPVTTQRRSNDCYRVWDVTVRVYSASSGFGRAQPWAIADAVDAALDQASMDLDGPFAMASTLAAAMSGDVIEPLSPKMVFTDFTCIVSRADATD